MLKFSANLSLLFTEYTFLQRFIESKNCGFDFVEFWFPYDYNVNELNTIIQDSGVTPVLFNLYPGNNEEGEWGLLGIPGKELEFRRLMENALEIAQVIGCKKINALIGIRPENTKLENCIDTIYKNIEWGVNQLPIDSILLIEALNKTDKPGYIISEPESALKIVRDINRRNFGLLLDIYHAAIEESNYMKIIIEDFQWIRHIQLADSPGRHQPGTGKIPITQILNYLEKFEFKDYVGLEYIPLGKTDESFNWIKKWKV